MIRSCWSLLSKPDMSSWARVSYWVTQLLLALNPCWQSVRMFMFFQVLQDIWSYEFSTSDMWLEFILMRDNFAKILKTLLNFNVSAEGVTINLKEFLQEQKLHSKRET